MQTVRVCYYFFFLTFSSRRYLPTYPTSGHIVASLWIRKSSLSLRALCNRPGNKKKAAYRSRCTTSLPRSPRYQLLKQRSLVGYPTFSYIDKKSRLSESANLVFDERISTELRVPCTLEYQLAGLSVADGTDIVNIYVAYQSSNTFPLLTSSMHPVSF